VEVLIDWGRSFCEVLEKLKHIFWPFFSSEVRREYTVVYFSKYGSVMIIRFEANEPQNGDATPQGTFSDREQS